MTNKKKIIYFGVALVGAYFLFPQAQTLFDYVKGKLKKKGNIEPEKNTDKDKK